MVGIVNDILDAAQLRANDGKVAMKLASTPIHSLVEEAAAGTRVLFRENVSVTVDLDSRLPTEVVTDRRHLQQVVTNFLSNAAKHTPAEGHVTLSARCLVDEWTIRVQDSGPGVEPRLRPRLFQPFAIGDHGREGTGLGLHICRAFVEALGGTVGADFPDNGGSIFWLRLPLAAPSGGFLATVSSASSIDNGDALAGLHFLVVDDNAINRKTLARLVETLERLAVNRVVVHHEEVQASQRISVVDAGRGADGRRKAARRRRQRQPQPENRATVIGEVGTDRATERLHKCAADVQPESGPLAAVVADGERLEEARAQARLDARAAVLHPDRPFIYQAPRR
eukprot:TRINITY_DN9890_c0_g1_i1.p2 TRINITY_DN9890_c0_g1~~TRINITY_DN9890_c0_g1_i1.p2  ORF type:complete len:339 (-),score=58.31 TRINITY_DN9890_c0_g1_i1:1006-2022(-)